MQQKRDTRMYLLVDITAEEKAKAKALAKSNGMTLQGWIARLLRKEISATMIQREDSNA